MRPSAYWDEDAYTFKKRRSGEISDEGIEAKTYWLEEMILCRCILLSPRILQALVRVTTASSVESDDPIPLATNNLFTINDRDSEKRSICKGSIYRSPKVAQAGELWLPKMCTFTRKTKMSLPG